MSLSNGRAGSEGQGGLQGSGGTNVDRRSATRFPLEFPVTLRVGGREQQVVTRNVSACGVLIESDESLEGSQSIQFLMRMPGAILGTSRDVLVLCAGRVVRCSLSKMRYLAAATIDSYEFEK